jgi:hypothetical protein
MFRGASSGAIHNPLRARCAERVRKMRAMQLAEPGKPLRLVDREIGKPGSGSFCFACSRAAFAAPTCISSTASCLAPIEP